MQDAFAECALGTLSAVLLVFSLVSASVHIVHVNLSNQFILRFHFAVPSAVLTFCCQSKASKDSTS